MSDCGSLFAIDGARLKVALEAAVAAFPRHIDAINHMNVFPVPDGDTGTNMFHTLSRAWREIEDREADAGQIAQGFAHGALMGARGNSGTILSQLLRGFADALDGAETLDAALLSSACQGAVTMAYAAVMQPVEGTILTVAREAATALHNLATESTPIDEALAVLIVAADESLQETPKALPVLRQAGVVDAGGMGLLCFLRGLQGDAGWDAAQPKVTVTAPAQSAASESSHFGYDLQFLMRGGGLDIDAIRQELARMGDSLLVVGDESTVKVHIHVTNPAPALDYAISCGAALDDVVVENMDLQSRRLSETRDEADSLAVVAVANGAGFHAIYEELGAAAIVDGGQSANPSVEDMLWVLERVDAERVVILPNNRNVTLSARQAANLLSARSIDIVESRTPLQGISAMLALANARELLQGTDELIAEMRRSLTQVCSVEITLATRSAVFSDMNIKAGEYLALVDGDIQAHGATLKAALFDCLAALDTTDFELATFYRGADMPESQARALIQRLSNACPDLECELVFGGQSLYPLLIGLE